LTKCDALCHYKARCSNFAAAPIINKSPRMGAFFLAQQRLLRRQNIRRLPRCCNPLRPTIRDRALLVFRHFTAIEYHKGRYDASKKGAPGYVRTSNFGNGRCSLRFHWLDHVVNSSCPGGLASSSPASAALARASSTSRKTLVATSSLTRSQPSSARSGAASQPRCTDYPGLSKRPPN